MKSFFELPVLTNDPSLGLMADNGIHNAVKMIGYGWSRDLSDVLSWSTPVSDIHELSEISSMLDSHKFKVLRVGTGAGGTQLLSDQICESPAAGEKVIAICEAERLFNVFSINPKIDIVQKFAWLAIQDRLGAFRAPWALQTALRSIFNNYPSIAFLPQYLAPTEDVLNALPEWWGLGVSATTPQACQFTLAIAGHCSDWQTTLTVISTVEKWLSKTSGSPIRTFDDLYNEFREDVPLAALAK